MENKTFINSWKGQYFSLFSKLHMFIKLCPSELWNKDKSGFIF